MAATNHSSVKLLPTEEREMVEKGSYSQAGLPSTKFHLPSEPPLVQKRKLDGHNLKRTYTTDHLENSDGNTEVGLPTNQALLYKAGYRRVQFTTPTEYHLQYGSPLLKGTVGASPLLQATAENRNHENKQTTESKRPANDGAKKKTCKHRHVVNGAPVNGRSHTIMREQTNRQTLGGQNGGRELAKGDVHAMQRNFEEKMGRVIEGGGKSLSHEPRGGTKEPQSQIHEQRRADLEFHVPRDSSKSYSSAKKHYLKPQRRKKKSERNKENVHQPRTDGKKQHQEFGDHRRSSTYPLITEYQFNFNRVFSEEEKAMLKKQYAESGQGIGFKDHVKDIMYFCPANLPPARGPTDPPPLRIPKSPSRDPSPLQRDNTTETTAVKARVITPQSYTSDWTTEYTTNFVSPVQLSNADRTRHSPDSRMNPPTPVKSYEPQHQFKGGVADPAPILSWFDQVLELRKKALEYKQRAEEGSAPPDYLQELRQHQAEKEVEVFSEEPISSSTPTLSVSSLSQEDETSHSSVTRGMSLHRPSVVGEEGVVGSECSNQSICGSCHDLDDEEYTREDEHPSNLSQAHGNTCTCTRDLSNPAHVSPDPVEEDLEYVHNTRPRETTKQPGARNGGPRAETATVKRAMGTPPSSHHPLRRPAPPLHPVVPTRNKPKDIPVSRPTKTQNAPVLVYSSKPKPSTTIFLKPSQPSARPLPSKTTKPLYSPVSHTSPTPTPPSPPRPTPPAFQHPHAVSGTTDMTCQTCGGRSPSGYKVTKGPSHPLATSSDCEICHYTYNQSTNPMSTSYKAPPTSSMQRSHPPASSFPRSSVPICPPSCPNTSLGKDDSFSLSSVSFSSSCSVASDILERARKRHQDFWSSKAKN